MKGRPAKIHRTRFALFVMLALQLVVGLQLQAAQAVHAGMLSSVAHASLAAGKSSADPTTAHEGCASHPHFAADDGPGGRVPDWAGNQASTGGDAHRSLGHHTAAGQHSTAGGHDCCHASGACQCHCVNPPAAIDLPALANIATFVAVHALADAQFVAPRIDEFLRPPIA